MRRFLKVFHVLGSIGLTGALACYMILLAVAPTDSPEGYAVVRRGIEAISGWLLVPSLVVALVTGLFAIAVHPPFQNAGWVWAKAALGLPMFEGTLVTIDSTAQRAAEVSAQLAAGTVEPAVLSELVAREWNALWIIMVLSIAQTVLGVWRPRRRRRRASSSHSSTSDDAKVADRS